MNKTNQILKVLKLLHSFSKKLIPITFFKSLINAVAPFVPIVASSIVIDKLISKAEINELLLVSAFAVIASVAVVLLQGYFRKQSELQQYYAQKQMAVALSTKVLNMDYANIEDPKTHLLKQSIYMDQITMGGIWNVFWFLEVIFTSLLKIIISGIILTGLFQTNNITMTEHSWIASPLPLIALLIIVVATIILTSFVGVKLMKAEFKVLGEMTEGNRVFSFLTDIIHNYKTGKDIRVYKIEPLMSKIFDDCFKKTAMTVFKKMCKIEGLDDGISGVVSGLIGGLVYLFVGLKAWLGIFGIGSVVRYAGAIHEFISNFSSLIRTFINLKLLCDKLQNVFDALELEDKMYKGSLPIEKRSDNEYEIEFKNVSFMYAGTTNYALKNLNLKFNVGQRLAVVGMNGSGKTTMIKLLCRLYDPTSGVITLNGIDIKKYKYDEYMSIFSVVFQDFKLFSFSLGQNVAAAVNFDKKSVEAHLKQAGFSDRVSTMAKGLDTPLYKDFEEDGVEISGGEAQKIAIARALYKNAPFIVLDEPTAALDPIAEFEIYSKFNEIVGEKSAIYISHRLSSCRFCNDIAVFHEGELIERGSHDELVMNESSKYHELWNAQAQYYK